MDDLSQKFKLHKVEKVQGTKTLKDGVYEIEPKVDEKKAVEVRDATQTSGGNVQIFNKNNALCQKVNVTYIGEGYYTIEFRHSKKLLDVTNGKKENHTNVWQCNPNGSDAQKWIIQEAGDGFYYVISKLSNTYLTVAGGGTVNCTNIEIMQATNENWQKFKFHKMEQVEAKETIPTGLYEIETGVDSQKVLEVRDAIQVSGGNVQIFAKNNAKCQRVMVDSLGNGYYTLAFLHSGIFLDVANGSTQNHTNVWQCRPNGEEAQEWIIKEAGGGYYNIISKLDHNMYLTVAGGGNANCTNIEINVATNDASQKFKFNKIEEFYGANVIEDGLYEIETKVDSQKVIEVRDATQESGGNVQIFRKNNNANCQKVQITHIGNGMYNIEFLHSGMMLDVANAGIADHTNVWQCRPNGAPAQIWAIRSTHDGYYNIVSQSNKKYLTVANGGTANCTNIEINSEVNNPSQQFKFNKTNMAREIGVYGSSGLIYQGNSSGSQLPYYRYGFGKNVLFATFAVHGFEDNWYRDGQALTQIADRFYNRLINDSDLYIARNWTVYIFPSVNPDGEYYGTTNAGPGRRTLFSRAPGNAGIDINRSWQSVGTEYRRFTDARNYNGTAPYQAYEAEALRNFLIEHKSNGGKTLLIDLHGWENSLIGDQSILNYYAPSFSSAAKKYGQYGQQYLISWARTDLNAQTALIELPNWIRSMQEVESNDLYNKYINSSINLLKNIPISEPRRARAKVSENITQQEQFNIAYAGLIKNELPTEEEVQNAEKQPITKNGIYIESNAKESILEIINEVTNLTYAIDEEGFLQLQEEQLEVEKNQYDDFLQRLINENKTYLLSRTGKLYFKDIVTREITVDLYEDLDPYQTYNYTEYEDKIIIDITTNKEGKLTNKEIMQSLIDLLK